jgi:diketogulonate reductase-like aldo/keto reductase
MPLVTPERVCFIFTFVRNWQARPVFFLRYVPLPKSATPARIHSNAKLYDFELADEDMTKLDGLDRGKDGAISWNPVDAA